MTFHVGFKLFKIWFVYVINHSNKINKTMPWKVKFHIIFPIAITLNKYAKIAATTTINNTDIQYVH